MRGTDPRSYAGKAPVPERHVPLIVVGAGPAGTAAAIEAARAGVDVLLVDEHPVDNDMMAMDVPLCFGQRMDGAVRNRALMLERVVETNPAIADAYDAGVDVELGTCVWGAFANGESVHELPAPMLALADDRRSWLVGYDRLVVAAGARDVLMGFAGWERAGVLGAGGAAALLMRYRALAARRVVIVGSGDLGLRTAALALSQGLDVAAVVEVRPHVRGDVAAANALADRGVIIATGHTIAAARGRTGEVESVTLTAVDRGCQPIAGTQQEIACDAVIMAIGMTPNVELLHLVGARLAFVSALGGWVPELDASMRTSVPTVFAAGDCSGVHDDGVAHPTLAREQGRVAGRAAAASLQARHADSTTARERGTTDGESPSPQPPATASLQARDVETPATATERVHGYWQRWLDSLIASGGWDVNVCQCEEVTRRELVETKPPRYLGWDSPQMNARSVTTLRRDGPINQDQIKRLTRAGMGPCQGRRCREQVGLLLAQAAGTTPDRIPLPTFRPPVRPLPLAVLWPADEPSVMREEWVSWFGIPTQFSPHWEPGMAMDEPTAHARLITSDE